MALCCALIMCGCAGETDKTPETTSPVESVETTAEVTTTAVLETTPVETTTAEPEVVSFEETQKAVWFSKSEGFYSEDLDIELKVNGAQGVIRYTLDGSEPTETSEEYTGKITLLAANRTNPNCYLVRAKVFYSDGSSSEDVAHTYFVDVDVDERFTTYVFALWGDPDEIATLLENYSARGRESEKEIYVAAFDDKGNWEFSQFCGVRVYGGASRESSIKSLKLFARKSYDSLNGKFKTDMFGTLDEEGKVIDKYDKLVLRNAGNDFQFAYIRDELNQVLAMKAGYTDYEGVIPVVGYLNGSYYGFYWLHENYCDEYFQQKYGKADGEFVVIEGNDQWKFDKFMTEDEEPYYNEFNEMYQDITARDLTDDAVYAELKEKLDVENYLDYFAFNIYFCNADWPNNNMKCYRYYAPEGSEYGEGVYDGRWRFLLHDMDYSYGMYDQTKVMANYDNLKRIMNASHEKYAPLFTLLMQREDCRMYFADKLVELMNGVFTYQSIIGTLEEMSELRATEMAYYYQYLEGLRNQGDASIWTRSSHLQNYYDQIKAFATSRPAYMIKFMEADLGVTIVDDNGTFKIELGE